MRPLRRLAALYAVQLRLLRRWSGGPATLLVRGVLTAAVSAAAFIVTAWLSPGIRVHDVPTAVVAALVLAGATTLARPVLIALLSGVSILLTAVVTVALQIVAFWLLSRVPGGLEIAQFGDAVRGALIYSLGTAVLTACLSIGDDKAFFGTLARQLAIHHRSVDRTDKSGVVVIQIDGLSHSFLERQLHAGRLPILSHWIRSREMTLDSWQTLLPSQTSASQAGILHGNNDGIPAFRWWDKRTGRFLVSNHPADAKEILRRVSRGDGLLANGGASIGNLLSGDATRSYLTAATIDDPARELRRSHVLDWFFISPYSYVRWIVLSIGEVFKEIVQARRERIIGLTPLGERGFPYPLARAATNVLLRHLTTALVIEEMYRGAPIIYVDFVDYDEIAHHAGPDRAEARDAVAGVDRIIGLIATAAADTPRPYKFIVLSDHGQSPGASFQQRSGRTLEALVEALTGKASVRGATAHVEHWGRITPLASEASRVKGLVGALTGRSFHDRAVGGAQTEDPEDIVVAGSGNLALVSFPRLPGRVSLEAISVLYPELIGGLARHPGIGFVMVRSDQSGAVVIGGSGVNYLRDGRVEGVDPLRAYGPHAAAALKRVDAMAECGDLVIISQVDVDAGAVASFESQIGTHGGLGGEQTRPFVAHPAEWRIDEPIIGATALHSQIRAWLARL